MNNTSMLIEQDIQHWVHPVVSLRQHEAIGSRVWVRAEGVHLIDTEGRRVQDAFSGLWCVNAGYGQQSLIDAATRQLQT
ncbi:MAG: aspartate aminotransferase family protein, partial [Pararhizobium sp.]